MADVLKFAQTLQMKEKILFALKVPVRTFSNHRVVSL